VGNIRNPFSSVVREWYLETGSHPWDIDIDSNDNIWFTESGKNRIGKLNPATNEITEYAIPTM
jgi:streptogramin lyase